MFSHIKPPAGTQINPLHPLSRGLVGCWLFNEGAGSLVNDISRNENHGRLTNMAPNVQGSGWGGSKFGGGLEFDGVDDYVDCGSQDLGNIDITVSMWLKTNDTADSYIFGGWHHPDEPTATPPKVQFTVNVGADTHVNMFSSATSVRISSTTDITDNKWHHIVFLYTGTAMKIFIDGIEEASGNAGNITWNNWQWQINNDGGAPTSLNPINGSIDSVRIYNRALSAEEIAWSYREPYVMFEPSFNPALLYSAAPPVGAIMNQFQRANIGADLYNGVFA